MTILDLTAEQTEPPGRPDKYRMAGRRVARVQHSKRTGITMHQTACVFGVSAAQVKQAGGDRVLAKHRRALNVASNITAFNTGVAVLANPLDWYIYHGDGFNSYTYSLESEGCYCGLKGQPKTYPGPASDITVLTAAVLQATRDGLVYLYETGRRLGAPLEYIYAHRQGSATRRADPGEELWVGAVIDFAVPVLKLKVNNTLVLPPDRNGKSGYPIPMQWDPSSTAKY